MSYALLAKNKSDEEATLMVACNWGNGVRPITFYHEDEAKSFAARMVKDLKPQTVYGYDVVETTLGDSYLYAPQIKIQLNPDTNLFDMYDGMQKIGSDYLSPDDLVNDFRVGKPELNKKYIKLSWFQKILWKLWMKYGIK